MESEKRERDDVAAEEGDPKGAVKKVRTHKKRRMAVLYGYRGKGYHGSAKGGGQHDALPTVEADLEKALKAAGAIDEAGNLSNISFSRASRTDKGVSAMVNAFGANLYFSQEEIDRRQLWVDRVNSFLPEAIRVWTAMKVRGSFSAKDAPCSRSYDYVAPSFCFRPKDEETAETPAGTPFVMSETALANLNALLLYFLGTNNFHNYTNGKNVNSSDAKRIIMSFRVLDKKEINGQEFLHFRIKGQSFMLHQIRKMMCMVMQVARQGGLRSAADLERGRKIVNGSFGGPHLNIMKAPSVGLFLKEVHFDFYNKAWGTGEGRERVELSEEMAATVEEFARTRFWPDIAAEAEEFRNFLSDMAEYPMSFDEVVATSDQMEAERARRNQSREGEKISVQHF